MNLLAGMGSVGVLKKTLSQAGTRLNVAVFRDYGSTFVTEFAVMASQIIVYKLAALYLGTQGFAEYAVARRTISLIYPVALLGLGVALPRYVAYANGQANRGGTAHYLGSSLLCAAASTALGVAAMNVFKSGFAQVFFGGKEYAYLVPPLSAMLVGLVLHTIVNAYFRGQLNISFANRLQLVNLGLVPPLAFLVFGKSTGSVLITLGMMWTTVAVSSLLFLPLRQMFSVTLKDTKALLKYGMPRVPGDLTLMALLALPATIVAHTHGLEQAGLVAFAISIMAMVASAFAPIGLIVLPKASWMIGRGENVLLGKVVTRTLKMALVISFFLMATIEVFGGVLTQIYLGRDFAAATSLVRVVSIGLVPYCLYVVSRGFIDACHERAMNTRNLICAFATFVLLCLVGQTSSQTILWVPGAFVVSTFVLGGLSFYEVTEAVKNDSRLCHKI